MRPILFAIVLASLGLTSACGQSAATPDAKAAADALTGVAEGTSPQCKLFSPTEIAAYIGEPVNVGQDAAGGCQWTAKDGSGDVIVAVVPAANHEPPKSAEGYRPLTAPGQGGFVAPYLGGWLAGAIVGERAVRVSVDGQTASADQAETLLSEAANRLGG